MLRNHGWFVVIVVASISFIGCGKSEAPSEKAPQSKSAEGRTTSTSTPINTAKLEPAAAACYEFLEAVRTGNDEKAATMLSTIAREKAAALNRSVTPPASDTAKFTIGKVEHISDDLARVESTWTDVDENGETQSDKAIWGLRFEKDGWKIAGVAATIFPGEEPLILNFEDPEDMIKKSQWAREEIRRRMDKDSLQAKETEKNDNSMRR